MGKFRFSSQRYSYDSSGFWVNIRWTIYTWDNPGDFGHGGFTLNHSCNLGDGGLTFDDPGNFGDGGLTFNNSSNLGDGGFTVNDSDHLGHIRNYGSKEDMFCLKYVIIIIFVVIIIIIITNNHFTGLERSWWRELNRSVLIIF